MASAEQRRQSGDVRGWVLVDRFANGDASNDRREGTTSASTDYVGGDWAGLAAKLDDLAELGVLKGPSGYQLPGAAAAVPAPDASLARALRRELLSIAVGGTLVVLKSPVGHGNALGIELDRMRMQGVLGTIAALSGVAAPIASKLMPTNSAGSTPQ